MLEKDNIEYKKFVWQFSNLLKNREKDKQIIFLCIGTNKVIGDSIGPIVGTNLKRKINLNKNVKVVGDLENNIYYEKIEQNLRNFQNEENLVIVIDSALSSEENIGRVFVQNRGLKYGESLLKENSVIGNISIKAVVGKNSNNKLKNFKILRSTSINNVISLSNIVSNGIAYVINSCHEYKI